MIMEIKLLNSILLLLNATNKYLWQAATCPVTIWFTVGLACREILPCSGALCILLSNSPVNEVDVRVLYIVMRAWGTGQKDGHSSEWGQAVTQDGLQTQTKPPSSHQTSSHFSRTPSSMRTSVREVSYPGYAAAPIYALECEYSFLHYIYWRWDSSGIDGQSQ